MDVQPCYPNEWLRILDNVKLFKMIAENQLELISSGPDNCGSPIIIKAIEQQDAAFKGDYIHLVDTLTTQIYDVYNTGITSSLAERALEGIRNDIEFFIEKSSTKASNFSSSSPSQYSAPVGKEEQVISVTESDGKPKPSSLFSSQQSTEISNYVSACVEVKGKVASIYNTVSNYSRCADRHKLEVIQRYSTYLKENLTNYIQEVEKHTSIARLLDPQDFMVITHVKSFKREISNTSTTTREVSSDLSLETELQALNAVVENVVGRIKRYKDEAISQEIAVAATPLPKNI